MKCWFCNSDAKIHSPGDLCEVHIEAWNDGTITDKEFRKLTSAQRLRLEAVDYD